MIDRSIKMPPRVNVPAPNLNIQMHQPFEIPPEIQRPAHINNRSPLEEGIRGMIRRLQGKPTPADTPPPQEPAKPELPMRSVLEQKVGVRAIPDINNYQPGLQGLLYG